MNLQSSGSQSLPEFPLGSESKVLPGLHPALATVLDDTAGEALLDLPGVADLGRAEMCNIKGDRRRLHRDSERGRRERARQERISKIINGSKPVPNLHYPHGPAPYKYPHALPFQPNSVISTEEN